MDNAEFTELTEATVRGLLNRVPAKYREGFQVALDGGELTIAVEGLMMTLVDDQVPVTRTEHDNLALLLAHLKQPSSALNRLNVRSQ